MTYAGDVITSTAHPLGNTVIYGGDVWLIDPDLNIAGAHLRTLQIREGFNILYRGTDSENPTSGDAVAAASNGSGIVFQNIFFPAGEGLYLNAESGSTEGWATVDYL